MSVLVPSEQKADRVSRGRVLIDIVAWDRRKTSTPGVKLTYRS